MANQIPPKVAASQAVTDTLGNPPLVSRPAGGGVCVVGVGASAGGLDACSRLLDALGAADRLVLILVQHLDPTHQSMLVELLPRHTRLSVLQATDGMPLAPGHLYVIPPGSYLSVEASGLRLSPPAERHGARHPFDFLLNSLARLYGPRAVAVVLSGNGADGSAGVQAIKLHHGIVLAQDPAEAAHDEMPRNAIMTGAVDLVLPIARIAATLLEPAVSPDPDRAPEETVEQTTDYLSQIIELLRNNTAHDFTLYKVGTLQRRINRRMAMSLLGNGDMARYLEILRSNPAEVNLLANDLLINVTAFFRDKAVFERLAQKIITPLIRDQPPDQPIRVWVAGCSTGEEIYSLVILFRERMAALKRLIRIQFFASDVDPEAIAFAREGLYSTAIEAEVSGERLAQFFTREVSGYRVQPDVRAAVVFTVQDLLVDPPFSRIDLVSCRNLLIYLRPEAQAKVIALFHFALRTGGTLLLGSSETMGPADGRFEVISKPDRLFRRVSPGHATNVPFGIGSSTYRSSAGRLGAGAPLARPAALADLCRRVVMESYAPAAMLINQRHECLYSVGPTARYLSVAPGPPSNDLLTMVPPSVRTRLRVGLEAAAAQNARVRVPANEIVQEAGAVAFGLDIQPVAHDGERLLLVCFVDEPSVAPKGRRPAPAKEGARVAELQRELEATRTELRGAIRTLEISSEEQTTINQEALSVNEEYQSTNEELLTSKEELQSLNEELTALNAQLHETLERQRTTSNDLQNILYSTDIATLFLDTDLKIRFFTPATKALFNVIATDVGRPLADLRSLASDRALLGDAALMLNDQAPIEREIEAQDGAWYLRRIMPYRTEKNAVAGVVITFNDISDRKRTARDLEAAKQLAEQATVAKSRFLAAASHDLRQPLQTLALLQGLLSKLVIRPREQQLVSRIDQTLVAMSGMLNTLLDLNQIEAGNLQPIAVDFPVSDVLDRVRDEFAYLAEAKGVTLVVVGCRQMILSDPRMLEQMIRNLVANAIKYTVTGKVLVGCRRRDARLSIEVWDSGIGIPADQLGVIFEEYHQIDNDARDRSRGLGLGLSIVKRLGLLLGQPVTVSSRLGRGSCFRVDVTRSRATPAPMPPSTTVAKAAAEPVSPAPAIRTRSILVVEDDPEVRTLLDIVLQEAGHQVRTALDGTGGLKLVAEGEINPDLIITDYNLPDGANGLQFIDRLRRQLGRAIPTLILTGDISTDTLRNIEIQNCVHLNKPVKITALTTAIDQLLAQAEAAEEEAGPVIFVVDDDEQIRALVRAVLETDGHRVRDYPSCEEFLAAYQPGAEACLLIDAILPGMSGLDLIHTLAARGETLPTIMITGKSDVPMAVAVMKAGASDFIEKPISSPDLLAAVRRALEQSRDAGKRTAWREEAVDHMAGLTPRQRQIMELVLAGHPSKNIAADLGVSQRTVENHRAAIMKKTGSKSLPALARLAIAAALPG